MSELNSKYKAFSKQSLKSCLKHLKSSSADPAEIKVVSNLLNEGQVGDNIKSFWDLLQTYSIRVHLPHVPLQ